MAYEEMTFQEALANFVAAGPREITGVELDAWNGLEGDGYIAEIPAPLGGEDLCIVMDVTEEGLTLGVYTDTCALQIWTLRK
jgi:hypothetical protein